MTVTGKLSRAAPATTLRVSLSRGGEAVARLIFHFRSADFEAALAVPDAAPWSPRRRPNLYAAVIELIAEGAAVDAVERVVGFRRFEAREGRLFLNGRPFFMMGALDQDWHPGRGPPASKRPVSRTTLRQRQGDGPQYAPVPRQEYPNSFCFDLADRQGLIVWLDLPYAEFLAASTREGLREVFLEVRRRAWVSSLDRNLDAVQRGMGHRPRRQRGRSALAHRDLRYGEDARPRNNSPP